MVRFVEVPVKQIVTQEVRVPKIVKVPRHVPQPEIEYVDRYVRRPQVQYTDVVTEAPEPRTIVHYEPKLQYIDMAHDNIDYVPKVETRIIEKHVNIPGEFVEISRPTRTYEHTWEPYLHHHAKSVPVTQICEPKITLSANETYPTNADIWIPRVIPFDIYIPKLVDVPLYDNGECYIEKYPVNIPYAHMRELEESLNPYMEENMKTVKPDYYPSNSSRRGAHRSHLATSPRGLSAAACHCATCSQGGRYSHLVGERPGALHEKDNRSWFPGYGHGGSDHLYLRNAHPQVNQASYR